MPIPTEVAIYKRDGSFSLYTSYASARADAVDFDLIQIRADLNEQIVLKDKVDIWIMPGVVIDNTNGGATITDNSVAVMCKIYGEGIIKNTRDVGTTWYECIKISNSNSSLSVECDYIEAYGGTSANGIEGPCIDVVNAKKFHLKCNKVYNVRNSAIVIGKKTSSTQFNVIGDINLKISDVETGDSTYGTSALLIFGIGFININEILCRNLGHCLSLRGGEVVARIKKMTSRMNRTNFVSTVHIDQGTSEQKLVLYFDEILNLSTGSISAITAIEHHQGTGIFIGRSAFTNSFGSNPAPTIQISKSGQTPNGLPKGYLKINNITSVNGVTLTLNDFNEQITIDANHIEGNGGTVIYSSGSSTERGNYFIKNAKIINKSTSSSAKGIYFENIYPIVTLNNVKIISGSEVGSNIFLGNGSSIDVYNYGLFGNLTIQSAVNLKIGPKPGASGYNYQCIIDEDLT